MAEENYIDSVIDENGNSRPIKDTALAERVDEIEETIGNGNYPGGGTSEVAKMVKNHNGGGAVNLWIGTREQYSALPQIDPETVYLIGTVAEGYTPVTPPDVETKYTVRLTLTNCSTNSIADGAQVVEGSSLDIVLLKSNGYSFSYVDVLMGGVSIKDESWDSNSGTIHIDEVTDDVDVIATAIVKLESITVRKLVKFPQTDNDYKFYLEISPSNTSERNFWWRINNETDFSMEVSEDKMSAVLTAKQSASNADVTVTCTSLDNPTIGGTNELHGITYIPQTNPEPGTDPEPLDTDPIEFDDTLVKSRLLDAGAGSNGEITYGQAAEWNGTLAFNGAAITSFDEWQYFKNANISVNNCSRLSSVVLPKIVTTDYFDSRFKITGTAITSIAIPEDYLHYGHDVPGNTNLNGNPLSGNIESISFPSTLVDIIKPFKELPEVTEIDLSGTQVSHLCAQAFTSLAKLDRVIFPDTLLLIDKVQPFRLCHNLTHIEFGSDFTGTSENVGLFYDGAGATIKEFTIVFRGTTPPGVFNITPARKSKLVAIKVPTSAVQTYKSDDVFSEYAGIISAIDESND